MLVIVIHGFTCKMLIKLPEIEWDKSSEYKQIYCEFRTNKKLSGFYCRSVYFWTYTSIK